MMRAVACGLAFLAMAASLRAGDFAIDLTAAAGKASKTAYGEQIGVAATPKPRPVLEVQPGQQVKVTWVLRRTAAGTATDVLVHGFVVREAKTGRQGLPKLNKNVVAETALTMDFKPRDRAEGELTFQIEKPGSYLLRLETIETTGGANGPTHFAALDVVVR